MWTDRQIDSLIDRVMRRLLHWWCLWSKLTSCTWTDRRIDSLIDKAMRRSLHWWCLWSRLTSCMWTDRWIDSLIDRAMRRSLHWRCHWSRLTESLLLEIETLRSSMTDLVWLFNKFEEFLMNLNERLIRWSLT